MDGLKSKIKEDVDLVGLLELSELLKICFTNNSISKHLFLNNNLLIVEKEA